jgi:phosphopantothenate--cysteine ligase
MNIIITAGGTKEAIDKVRHITNMATGELGRKILETMENKYQDKIDKIYFLSPKVAFPQLYNQKIIVECIEIDSVEDLYNQLQNLLTTQNIDAVIHSMAVSDFSVNAVFTFENLAEYLSNELSTMEEQGYSEIFNLLKNVDKYKIDNSSKISSKSEHMGIYLKPTPKVIGEIKNWLPNTILVGFKLLEGVSNEELIKVAKAQMEKNDCDFVWANDITGQQGFLINKNTETFYKGKPEIALAISEAVMNYKRV